MHTHIPTETQAETETDSCIQHAYPYCGMYVICVLETASERERDREFWSLICLEPYNQASRRRFIDLEALYVSLYIYTYIYIYVHTC